MIDFHYVVFDGTSAFVCGADDIVGLDDDCVILKKFTSLLFANKFCDEENERILA